jgi:hypothetical protein
MQSRWVAFGIVGMVLSACGSEAGPSDAGAVTGGQPDAGRASADAARPAAPPAPVITGDSGACEVHEVGNGRVPPDMLIVLDRSSSMVNRGTDRWTPTVRAISTVAQSLDGVAKLGLMLFPGGEPACATLSDPLAAAACAASGGGGVKDSCAPGKVNVPVGPSTSQAIATLLAAERPGGATPTYESLRAAHQALGSVSAGEPDNLGRVPPKYVLLVTDGIPNCTDGNTADDSYAVGNSVRAIEEMTRDGIKTFVLGYSTQRDPDASAALDKLAVAGGTGESTYRRIEDEASLLAALQQIAGSAVSCAVTLDFAPDDPGYVSVSLDGAPLELGAAGGWQLSDDRRTLTVQGSACETVKKNTGHVLKVNVECTRVN